MQRGKKDSNTVLKVWELAEPIAKSLGLDIWDIRFLKEGSLYYLRIFIDKNEGVTIEDCESMSRAIDKPLDDLDPIDKQYCLEVCSPGIERELIRPEHFEKYLGSNVLVKMIRPLENGIKEFKAQLIGYENQDIELKLEDDSTVTINKKNAAYIKLDDFEI